MSRFLCLASALVLLLASGITQRMWRGDWTLSDEPAVAAERLANLPMTLGSWEGQTQEVDAKQLVRAEVSGHLARQYVHRGTGARVGVFMVCGRPGPISVHTPDICYGGIGFEATSEQKRHRMEGTTATHAAEFITLDLQKPDVALPTRLRIYWSWRHAGADWRAPTYPRLAFGAAPALYKLYVTYQAPPGAKLPEHDPCLDFMPELLPELDKALFPPS